MLYAERDYFQHQLKYVVRIGYAGDIPLQAPLLTAMKETLVKIVRL